MIQCIFCCDPPTATATATAPRGSGEYRIFVTGLKSMGPIFDQNYTLEILCRFIPTFAIFRQNSLSFAHRLTEVAHFIWGLRGEI